MAISMLVAPGYLCCQRRSSGFKLALVVGHRWEDHRVRFWRAASGKWTLPQVVSAQDLDWLLTADREKHSFIEHAVKVALELKLVVRVWS